MNKNLNTVLFFLGATVAITLLLLLIIIIPHVIILLISKELFQQIIAISGPVSFLGAIVISFIVYSKVMVTLAEKVDMEKYFASWLVKKKRG